MIGKNPENFSIIPGQEQASRVSQEGIVSGEVGETSDEERLTAIGQEVRQDVQLAQAFDEAEGSPEERASMILDRINAMRRDLEASDSAEDLKRDRGNWLSDIANRLRELL